MVNLIRQTLIVWGYALFVLYGGGSVISLVILIGFGFDTEKCWPIHQAIMEATSNIWLYTIAVILLGKLIGYYRSKKEQNND